MSGHNELIQALFDNSDHAEQAEFEKIASANPLMAQKLGELEKLASDDGFDLDTLSDDAILEIIQQSIADDLDYEEGQTKVASPTGHVDLPEGVDMEKVAAAQFLGQVQAHAQFETLQELMGYEDGHEKLAGVESFTEEDLEKLAEYNANDILEVLGALDENNPAHYDIIDETAGREKVASIPMDEQMWELVGNRTAEMLDAAGWDVDAVGEALADLDVE